MWKISSERNISLIGSYVDRIDDAGELPLFVRRDVDQIVAQGLVWAQKIESFKLISGLICVRRSWPVWEAKFSDDRTPLIGAERSVADILVKGCIDSAIRYKFGEIDTDLDNKLLLGEAYFPAITAGYAAWSVMRDAIRISDSVFREFSGDSELDVSSDEWDPCFYASVAVAGGAVWEESGNAELRREFWEWYLKCAIPEAYAEAQRL